MEKNDEPRNKYWRDWSLFFTLLETEVGCTPLMYTKAECSILLTNLLMLTDQEQNQTNL